MKTSVSRNIDDLGRIVIPMEFRSKLNINKHSELEVYIEDNNKIIIQKIAKIDIDTINLSLVKIHNIIKNDIFIFKDNKIIIYIGEFRDEYINKILNEDLSNGDSIRKLSNFHIIENDNNKYGGYIQKSFYGDYGYGIIANKRKIEYKDLETIEMVINEDN